MSTPNPQVSVFHFTSNISKAKIQKYKLATERNMAPEHSASDQGNANRKHSRGNPSAARKALQSPSLGQPPAKKPRLELNVGPRPSESPGETIAVAQPRQSPALNIRYSNDGISSPQHGKERESTLPPPLSPPVSARSSSSSKRPDSNSTKKDYGDFMSYYVVGGDESDEPEVAVSKPQVARTKSSPLKRRTTKQQPIKPTSQRQMPNKPVPKKKRRSVPHIAPLRPMPPHLVGSQTVHRHHHHGIDHRQHHHHHLPLHHNHQLPPLLPHHHHHHHHHHRHHQHHMHPIHQPHALHQPTIQFIDVPTPPKPSRPDTVLEMIDKLSRLSAALTNFETGHPVREAVTVQSALARHPRTADASDNFLVQCEEASAKPKDLSLPPKSPGVPDHSLMYGVEFIQNALKSWAQQRLTQDLIQHFQQQQQQQEQRAAQIYRASQPFHDDAGSKQPEFTIPTGPVQLRLADTLEGAAIAAFQSVLDSGCLQVNALYPPELMGALRRLYVQIDHLINQGAAKIQTPWVCMSYQSQIAANKIRVEKWKEANARAQEETTRQQLIAQQHIMMQMGLQGKGRRMPANTGQARHGHVTEPARGRSLQHATKQPYVSPYHPHTAQLTTQPSQEASSRDNHPKSAGISSTAPFEQTGLLPGGVNGHTFTDISNLAPPMNGVGPGQVQLDKMKLYMPGFLPRSGQSMKFSFAPSNEAALHAFGSQAFPADQDRPDIPNREHIFSGPLPTAALPPKTSLEQESKKPQSSVSVSASSEAAPVSPIALASVPALTKAPATTLSDEPASRAQTKVLGTTVVDQPTVKKPRAMVKGRRSLKTTPVNTFTGINGSRRVAEAPSNGPAQVDGAESSEEDTIHVAMKVSPR